MTCNENNPGKPAIGSFHDNPYVKGSHRVGGSPAQFGTAFKTVFGTAFGMAPVLPDPNSADNPQTSAADRTVNPARPIGMWEVLAFQNSITGLSMPMIQAARHLVAAYLNTGFVADYPLTGTQCIDIWQQLVSKGTYCPLASCTPGQEWGPQQVVDYIAGTFQ